MNEANSQQNPSKFNDIGEILGILRKRKNIIIWTTVICAVLTLFVSLFIITPKYSSNTDILVNRKAENNQVAPQAQTQSEVKLPVGHTYYFIQMFDADSQVLRTVGSFFSKLDANVKTCIRRHLKRPLRQDFLMWKRVDGAAVTTVSPADSFDDVVAPHGACFIVGDKLTKDK